MLRMKKEQTLILMEEIPKMLDIKFVRENPETVKENIKWGGNKNGGL